MSFDKEEFARLLNKAKGDRSINQYAMHSGISSAHISRLMRGLLNTPPNPDTIKLLAAKAYNEITYSDLMRVAGHIEDDKDDYDFPKLITTVRLSELRKARNMLAHDVSSKIDIPTDLYKKIERGEVLPEAYILERLAVLFNISSNYLLGIGDNPEVKNTVSVANKEIQLSPEELKLFEELKNHPVLFHDLVTDPERKIKELLKLYEMKKMLLEEDTTDYGDGFGELKD